MRHDRYKLVPSAAGDLYRIRVGTGELHRLEGASLLKVAETDRIQLRPNAVYVFENGRTMKYLGDGKFEPFKAQVLTLDEYLKKQESKK